MIDSKEIQIARKLFDMHNKHKDEWIRDNPFPTKNSSEQQKHWYFSQTKATFTNFDDFLDVFIDSRLNNTFVYDEDDGIYRLGESNIYSVEKQRGGRPLITTLTTYSQLHLNPFSSSHKNDCHPPRRTLPQFKSGGWAFRFSKSVQASKKFSYMQSMIKFRKHLDQRIIKMMNAVGLYDVELYNKLCTYSDSELLYIEQFFNIYKSYPYSLNTLDIIIKGVTFKELLLRDNTDSIKWSSEQIAICNAAFRTSRILNNSHLSVTSLHDQTSFGVPSIVIKNWKDSVLSKMLGLGEHHVGLIALNSFNSLYNIRQDGLKHVFNALMIELGNPTWNVRARLRMGQLIEQISDTTKEITRLGYKMPTTIPKMVEVSNLYHDTIIKFKSSTKEKLSVEELDRIKQLTLKIKLPVQNCCEVNQLISADALQQEGREMKHCVSGYYNKVYSGATIIFSLSSDVGRSTIEYRYDPPKDKIIIVQHRGESNAEVTNALHLRTAQVLLDLFNKQRSFKVIKNAYIQSSGGAHSYVSTAVEKERNVFIYTNVIKPMKLGKTTIAMFD